MNNLLISEPPLQVLPSLAKELNSVDKAIILQQLHYWLNKSNNIKDGHRWVYNTVSEWREQFPWLSGKTVQRYLKDLESRGLLITGNYNKAKFDRTKWYRINYDALDNLGKPMGLAIPTKGTGSSYPKGFTDLTNTNRLPETTTETNKEHSPAKAEPCVTLADYQNIVGNLNKCAGTNYRATGKKTQRLIHARFADGFTAADFKTVIDNKVAEWKGTEMAKYLRPETLFGTKFESYLNQKAPQEQGEIWYE